MSIPRKNWHRRDLEKRTVGDRAADWVASFMGSWTFIIIQTVFVTIWIVLNICNVILYISAGLVFMPIVAVCYLVLNVIGVIHWKKEWKKQENYVENN